MAIAVGLTAALLLSDGCRSPQRGRLDIWVSDDPALDPPVQGLQVICETQSLRESFEKRGRRGDEMQVISPPWAGKDSLTLCSSRLG